MDKSFEYSTMCSLAWEVQKVWVPHHGDFFLGEAGKIEVWIEGMQEKRCLSGKVRLRFEDGMPRLRQYIWLPRLDQLMELAQEPGKRFDQTTQIFFEWNKLDYGLLPGLPGKIFSSLEQLWLAFVMHRKHMRKWNGTDWQRC